MNEIRHTYFFNKTDRIDFKAKLKAKQGANYHTQTKKIRSD